MLSDDPTEEAVIFYAERWFSKDGNRGKKNGKLERTFYCVGYDPEKMTTKEFFYLLRPSLSQAWVPRVPLTDVIKN